MAASDVDFMLVETRQQLRELSPLLQSGLAAIQHKGMSEDVAFGDLYVLLVSGQCECVAIRYCGEVVGFFVYEVCHEHTGGATLGIPYLFVDCPDGDLTHEVVCELDFIAGDKGCAAIRFKTTRAGWERRLAAHGFEPTAIELTRPVGA